MVKLGELNSRMKDFFDIWLLSSRYEFDAVQLATAIRATFSRRRTTMESEPIAFSRDFARTVIEGSPMECFSPAVASSEHAGGFVRHRGVRPRVSAPCR